MLNEKNLVQLGIKVYNEKADMTLDEKIGQIFVDMLWNNTEEEVKESLAKYGMGGFRYNNMPAEDLHRQNAVIQENSKIPALIAANIEAGGDGGVGGGKLVASGTPEYIAGQGVGYTSKYLKKVLQKDKEFKKNNK